MERKSGINLSTSELRKVMDMKRNLGKLKPFSELFNVSKSDVLRLGFFDITPAVDTKLYIDPKLLSDDVCQGFSGAKTTLKSKFDTLVNIISRIKREEGGDVMYEAAVKSLTFKEITGTCLGYSQESIDGNAFGPDQVKEIINRIKQLTDQGYISNDVLELVSIFTPGFGCDLTSDLITFELKDILFTYNEYIIKELNLEKFPSVLYYGHKLLRNPCKEKDVPIILVPAEILSSLPVCTSFYEISEACMANEDARNALQTYIDVNNKYTKDDIFRLISVNPDFAGLLFESYKNSLGNKYDFKKDPLCVIKYREFVDYCLNNSSSRLMFSKTTNLMDIEAVAKECLSIFKHLIENCGGWKFLQSCDEKGAQFIFYALSYTICKENNVSIYPEVDFGNGPVDFLMDNCSKRVSIEFKLSTNSGYQYGIKNQLPTYMLSNQSDFGFFVFINLEDKKSKKIEKVYEAKNKITKIDSSKIDIYIVQAHERPSASKDRS